MKTTPLVNKLSAIERADNIVTPDALQHIEGINLVEVEYIIRPTITKKSEVKISHR